MIELDSVTAIARSFRQIAEATRPIVPLPSEQIDLGERSGVKAIGVHAGVSASSPALLSGTLGGYSAIDHSSTITCMYITCGADRSV